MKERNVSTVNLGILTHSYMAQFAGDEDAPPFTVAMMTHHDQRGFQQRVAHLATLAELHRLIGTLRAGDRLGEIALDCGPDEHHDALFAAIVDTTATTTIN